MRKTIFFVIIYMIFTICVYSNEVDDTEKPIVQILRYLQKQLDKDQATIYSFSDLPRTYWTIKNPEINMNFHSYLFLDNYIVVVFAHKVYHKSIEDLPSELYDMFDYNFGTIVGIIKFKVIDDKAIILGQICYIENSILFVGDLEYRLRQKI